MHNGLQRPLMKTSGRLNKPFKHLYGGRLVLAGYVFAFVSGASALVYEVLWTRWFVGGGGEGGRGPDFPSAPRAPRGGWRASPAPPPPPPPAPRAMCFG